MLNNIKRFLVEEEGISSVEYAILLAFVAAVLITAMTALSGRVHAAICAAVETLGGTCP